jgi:hypothetical protein
MSEQTKGIARWASEKAGHIIPLFFCLLSLQNIQEFFYTLHPNIYISWSAGLALGFGLLFQAWKLSALTWDMKERSYLTVLATTIAFALVSGGIQAAAYAGFMTPWAAIPLGLALPIVGEVGVALSIAAHRQRMQEKRIENMQEDLGNEMRLQMMDAISTMNRSKLQDEVEIGAVAFAKALIEFTHDGMIADLQRNRKPKGNAKPQQRKPDELPMLSAESSDMQDIAEPEPATSPTIAELNEARRDAVAARRDAICSLLQNYGKSDIAQLQGRLQDDCNIDASERTIRDDLKVLIAESRVVLSSRGAWDIPQSVALIAETDVHFGTNGHSKVAT